MKIENIKTKKGFVTVSVGIASMTSYQNLNLEDLVREADQAMYNAKSNGKNRCEINEL